MGKRKRQVLFLLSKAYDFDEVVALDDSDGEILKDSFFGEREWGWMTREEILRNIAGDDIGKDLDGAFSPLTGMVLEIAPRALQDEYKIRSEITTRLADVLKRGNVGTPEMTESLEKFEGFVQFVRRKLLPFRHSPEFKKRWGSLRTSCYAAIRSLKKQGLIESEARIEQDLSTESMANEFMRHAHSEVFRITLAGRVVAVGTPQEHP
jgi:hypothetical protein